MTIKYEAKFKELTTDCGMGVYGMAELLGREADEEVSSLKNDLYLAELMISFYKNKESGYVEIPDNIKTADEFHKWIHAQ